MVILPPSFQFPETDPPVLGVHEGSSPAGIASPAVCFHLPYGKRRLLPVLCRPKGGTPFHRERKETMDALDPHGNADHIIKVNRKESFSHYFGPKEAKKQKFYLTNRTYKIK